MSQDSETSDIPPVIAPTDIPEPQTCTFQKADFTSPALQRLLEIHRATVTNPPSNVPGQQMYALDLRALQKPDIHLWTIWSSANDLLGCAALKLLNDPPLSGELKSMHTVSAPRGRGIGKLMLDKIAQEARKLGLRTLYLETGSMDAFREARRFYAGHGFVECGPFGDYRLQENSIFMCREI